MVLARNELTRHRKKRKTAVKGFTKRLLTEPEIEIKKCSIRS